MTLYVSIVLLTSVLLISAKLDDDKTAVAKRALQKEHELPQAEKWYNAFMGKTNEVNSQLKSLVELLKIITDQLNRCTVMVMYDSSAEDIDLIILEKLFKRLSLAYVHGKIDANLTIANKLRESTKDKCVSYMLFLRDVIKVSEIVKKQIDSKVVIISKSSQWRVHEFLSSDAAQNIVNLLIICKSEQIRLGEVDIPYILYTHRMYVDGLGSSKPQIIMSWYKNKLSQPQSPLFPIKLTEGFAGHRFIISVADQPPFAIRRGMDANDDSKWDGVEIRLINLLANFLNFTVELQEARSADILGSGDAVVHVLKQGKANIGLAGLYITQDRTEVLELTHGHSHDCAAFISLTSTALPRYRAIMGPFHWTVWVALTFTYLFAIFPIAFSDHLTLSHLIKRPEEIENMFWYVFGTFTNCFTFSGKGSWSKTTKTSTRMFVGWYWVFTIIISACYTGSIIAFVTLPIYPTTVDTVQQLLSGHFQMGTLDKGGWQYWFQNVSDKPSINLFKKMEYLPNVDSGLRNISRAFFWPYSFLGSRDQLDYIVRTNYTSSKKRSVLHISSECFVPFSVSFGFPKNSVYKNIMSANILRAIQSGLLIKMKNDVEWDIMRSSTGKLLQANTRGKIRTPLTDDRALTLQDTQGMFLLLSAGFIMGGASLLSEWLGGCFKFCKTRKRSRTNSVSTNPHIPTPNEKSAVDIEDLLSKESSSNVDVHHQENEHKSPVTVHLHEEDTGRKPVTDENESKKCNAETEAASHSDNSSSDLDYEINQIFNFDHLFGEDNSIATEETSSRVSENFGEAVNDVDDDEVIQPEVEPEQQRNELCNGTNH